MIDWTKQSEDILQSWADTQKRLLKSWGETAEKNAGQTEVADTWRKAVDTWEGAVKSGLEAQLEWSRSATESLRAVPSVPKDLIDWSDQTQALGDRWNAAQRQLWETYFGIARQAVPVKMLGTLDDENQKLFTAWQDAVEKMVAAQSEWSQAWSEQAAPKAASKAKKAASAAA